MAGRPPVPTNIKLLRGTARKDRVNPNEPKPATDCVKAPSWLKGRSRTAWKWVAPTLQEMGVLTTADPHALALLCDAYAEYLAAKAVIDEHGMSYFCEGKNGGMWRSRPEVAVRADAWRRVSAMMQQFGMTPSSRAKVSAAKQEDVDPFEQWMNNGHSSTG